MPGGLMQALFGAPQKSPAEQAKEWKRQLNAEGRKIDAQIRKIQREEAKAVKSAKDAAKQGDMAAVRIMSKEILHSRKATNRLRTAKTQLNSVAMQLQMQASQVKLAGSLQKSTAVMSAMNGLVKVGEISATMQAMSREMTKAGLIDEMVSDTLDSALDGSISEDELDEEVGKVVREVLDGQIGKTRVGSAALPQAATPAGEEEVPTEVEVDEEAEELVAKLRALKS